MIVKLHITTDNEAFADENCGAELARILEHLAGGLRDCGSNFDEFDGYHLRDVNGNKVGAVTIIR